MQCSIFSYKIIPFRREHLSTLCSLWEHRLLFAVKPANASPSTALRPPKRSRRQEAVAFVYALPCLKLQSPASLFVSTSLAVLNSSPINPSLKSQVRIAYFGFSFCCGLALALFAVLAIWLSARQSCMNAFSSPA